MITYFKFLYLQSILSYYLQPYPYTASMFKAHVRLGLAVLCTIFFIVVAVCGIISHILFEGSNPRKWLVHYSYLGVLKQFTSRIISI